MGYMNMRLFWLAAVFALVVVLGCSDGKINLLLVMWAENEYASEESSSSVSPGSSAVQTLPSSSAAIPSSSDSRPERSNPSRGGPRLNNEGVEYVDYPTLENNGFGVTTSRGGITRYWDDCKPSCSRPENAVDKTGKMSPYGLAKTCDRNDNEMPLFYLREPYNSPYGAYYNTTPNAGSLEPKSNITAWANSPTYTEWKASNPSWNFPAPDVSGGHICVADQIPYAVNDTLAYAFVANSIGNCGKCFMMQFDDQWYGDGGAAGGIRPTNKALRGKTLIVMVNNFGVGETEFDIMIPGGGVGACDFAFEDRLGINRSNNIILGKPFGGLLDECTFGTYPANRANPNFEEIGTGFVGGPQNGGIERYTLKEVQTCLRAKCKRTFLKPNIDPAYYKGCEWHVDWFMAADNPDTFFKEVDCPKYLVDRYRSTYPPPKRPDHLPDGVDCKIDGYGGNDIKCE